MLAGLDTTELTTEVTWSFIADHATADHVMPGHPNVVGRWGRDKREHPTLLVPCLPSADGADGLLPKETAAVSRRRERRIAAHSTVPVRCRSC
jgi:hypothetical protein